MKASPTTGKSKNSNGKSIRREIIEVVIIAVLLSLFIRTFVIQAFKIPSGSMQETLKIGDQILVNKFIYGIRLPFTDKIIIPFKTPERNEVIVFRYPKDHSVDYVKRVAAIGGDTVSIREKKLYVNGMKVENPSTRFTDSLILPPDVSGRDYLDPILVPQGKLFVLGDNRDESSDSRAWGFVDIKEVKGKAFIIYWSWDNMLFSSKNGRLGVRWHRIGHLIK